MFGTLRYSALEDDTEFIGRSCDPLLGLKDGSRYVACDRCRSKKLRCSGQTGGCDRCKRYSSTCVYSLDGKAKTIRRRKNPKGSNNSSGTSPPGEASSDTQGASKEGQDSTSKVREQEERATSATEQARQSGNVMQDMTDIFTAGSSPNGSFEGDFVLPDEVLNSFLPDVRGQGVYEYLNASNLPSQTEIDREAMFLDGVFELDRVDSMNTDPAPSDTSMTNAPMGATMNAEDSDISSPSPNQQRRQANRDSDAPPQAMIPLKTAQIQCRCLENVGVLLEGLDGKSHAKELTTLDSILASQKEALGRCNSVLNCPTCVARPEYIMFLELITGNLTSLCELTVSKYMSEAQSRYRDTLSGYRQQQGCRNTSAGSGKVFLGEYEIESPEEWSSLIRVLIGMQLRNLRTLLQRMATASSPRSGPEPGATRKAKVQATEERVVKLVQRLWQPRSRAMTMSIGTVR